MTSRQSGSWDVYRGLELLWGPLRRPDRRPNPEVTLERIVAAAIEVADEHGLDAVTLPRVAGELGVGTTSLYHHIPGEAELLILMVDRAQAPAEGELDGLVTEKWRETLESCAYSAWVFYNKHPWVLDVDQPRTALGPNSLRSVEIILSGVRDFGLTGPQLGGVLLMIDGYVTNAARRFISAANAEKRTGISEADFWAAQMPVLERIATSGEYPTLAGLPEDTFHFGQAHFDFGLQRLLDGLEVYFERGA